MEQNQFMMKNRNSLSTFFETKFNLTVKLNLNGEIMKGLVKIKGSNKIRRHDH